MKIFVHRSILLFLDFWPEWVLNFILAEKENKKVVFNPSKMSLDFLSLYFRRKNQNSPSSGRDRF